MNSIQYYELANFDAKTFELCESSTDYLWNCIAYTGAESDIQLALMCQTIYRA
jgi:hypothetical protein